MPEETPKPTHSYHFSLGNSTDGPIGLCARIEATSPAEAVARLKELLPPSTAIRQTLGFDRGPTEYIAVYYNPDTITEADIDEIDD